MEYKSQEILGITDKFDLGVQNEAGQRLTVLSRKHTGHSKHHIPTTQEMTLYMDQMANTDIRLIIFFASEDEALSIQSAKTRPGADCGSDHQLLIAKFQLKLKKVGKITRPFRYGQIKSLMIIKGR